MSEDEFKHLERGDIIAHVFDRTGLLTAVVMANYGERVTAVESFDITNPDEWTVVRKAGAK